MSHHYWIVRGGTVVAGGDQPPATALAWAWDTVLIHGSDEDVSAISRGDSHFLDLGGAVVVPVDANGAPDPVHGRLEIGGPADFAIYDTDPRTPGARRLALVRGGAVIEGALPDAAVAGHERGNRSERNGAR